MAKKGFTLIEVSLFLAITGLLFLGVTIGVQTSISRQRQNDSVQSFVEFLRTAYSEVSNVQNINGGRSDWALYGKLITFGENQDKEKDKNTIYTYDILGKTDVSPTSHSTLDVLSEFKSDVAIKENGQVKLVGIPGSYTPKWGAAIEKSCSGNGCSYESFIGALLIVRHPESGIINTYVSSGESPNINEKVSSTSGDPSTGIKPLDNPILFSGSYDFKIGQVDFCINPDPGVPTIHRRDVRIVEDAKNSSGVEIVSDSDDKNKCKENNK